MARVTHVERVSPETALVSLPTLSGATLIALDQAFRYGTWTYDETWPIKGKVALTPLQGDPKVVEAYLFVAACNPNGFIREQALTAFQHYPGRLAMAAALIRCNDWVPQVQQAAIELLNRLIAGGAGADLFQFLDFLLKLQQRQRIAEDVWPNRIEPELLLPEHRQPRWEASRQGSPEAKAFAYRLVLRADADRTNEALQQAIADGHLVLALWALSQARTLVTSVAQKLVHQALAHRHAPVRAEALRMQTAIDPASARALLEQALFDPARGPRNAAAYLLRTQFDESAIDRWRNEVDVASSAHFEVAVMALSEVAEPSDVSRLQSQLGHPRARVRAAALRGLWRAKAPELAEHLRLALRDSTSLVIRQAAKIYAHSAEALDQSVLEAAHGGATSKQTRLTLLHMARLLGKWESLDFLLSRVEDADDDLFVAIATELDRWIQVANNRFTPIADQARELLGSRVRHAQVVRPRYSWDQLVALL
jgi:HEAT repeat protein